MTGHDFWASCLWYLESQSFCVIGPHLERRDHIWENGYLFGKKPWDTGSVQVKLIWVKHMKSCHVKKKCSFVVKMRWLATDILPCNWRFFVKKVVILLVTIFPLVNRPIMINVTKPNFELNWFYINSNLSLLNDVI